MYSSKLSMSIHILCVIALEPCPVTSEHIANSVGTNPAVVRRLMSKLKRTHLILTHTKVGALGLTRPPEEINLLEIFHAVEPKQQLFDLHTGTSDTCPIGANICLILSPLYDGIQQEMENKLQATTLADLLRQFPPGSSTSTPPQCKKHFSVKSEKRNRMKNHL
ncbi:MAG TPA: Rrf2 family transcriptional regulator [Ruminococcaceae bacterium]|nr:Rrf2 family transcriptional regulator [Oscillospiraceae bacterium]